MKKLLFAAIALLIASPAFAAIQDVKVSGDIQETYLNRSDFGLGTLYPHGSNTIGASTTAGTPAGLNKQSLVASQTRIRVDADLSDNVSATVRLINETAWGQNATALNAADGLSAVDIDLAYVTLREFLYSPLTLSIGRQEFSFGNGLVIGAGGANNSSNGHFKTVAGDLTEIDSNDGVKAVLDYKPLTVTMFYFKNGQTTSSYEGFYQNQETSSDVYGINANYQLGDAYNTVLEGYLFSRINGSFSDGSITGGKGDTLYVPGLRASTNPIKGLNVQGELAWQLGNHPVESINAGGVGTGAYEAERRNAMAAQFMASYALPVLEKYKPTVNASFTYVSGDKNGNQNYNGDAVKSAKVDTAWDEFNKVQAGGTIYNALFPLSDMYIYSIGASANPLEDITTSFTWSNLYSAERFSATNPLVLIQPNTETVTPVTKAKGRGLGNESDVNVTYAYTEDVSFGVSLGWFVAGNAFSSVNDKTASQAIADVRVAF
jgi:hypothetical protein